MKYLFELYKIKKHLDRVNCNQLFLLKERSKTRGTDFVIVQRIGGDDEKRAWYSLPESVEETEIFITSKQYFDMYLKNYDQLRCRKVVAHLFFNRQRYSGLNAIYLCQIVHVILFTVCDSLFVAIYILATLPIPVLKCHFEEEDEEERGKGFLH